MVSMQCVAGHDSWHVLQPTGEANVTEEFVEIESGCKIRIPLIQILMIWSLQRFAHHTATVCQNNILRKY